MHNQPLRPEPLRVLRIPCICGGAHPSSTCPIMYEPAMSIPHSHTPTTTCTSEPTTTTHEYRKKRKRKPATSDRRWKEFRRQARRRKLSIVMEKRHYEALIKQPCVYCGHKTGHIGVDRVCNDQSYDKKYDRERVLHSSKNTTENACCTVCNLMKRLT